MKTQAPICAGVANSSNVSYDLEHLRQAWSYPKKRMINLLSFNLLVLTLVLLSSSCMAKPALAQATPTGSDRQLVEELESLARSDVDNSIARRTEFVTKLYGSNSSGLTAPAIRKIYDDAFSKQFKQHEDRQNSRLITTTLLGLLGLGASAYVVKKRKILEVEDVSVNLPFGIGGVKLKTVQTSRNAAWALYVELTTRIAIQQLEDDDGLLREALNSLYKLFEITRQILKDAGPNVGASPKTVGGIAIAVLNKGLRSFLAQWHPKLQIWEAQPHEGISQKEHEKNWPEEVAMRKALKQLIQDLEQYTSALAEIAGAP